jgi:hypothetical protein
VIVGDGLPENYAAAIIARAAALPSDHAGGHFEGRLFDKTVGFVVREKRFEFLAEGGIGATSRWREKWRARPRDVRVRSDRAAPGAARIRLPSRPSFVAPLGFRRSLSLVRR